MIKYAKITNEESKICCVGLGTNEKFYKSMDMTLQDVQQDDDGEWYINGFAPIKSKEQQNDTIRQVREQLMTKQADPLRFDYEENLARYGELDEKTIESKNIWLAKKDEIRADKPYIL